MLHVVLLLTLQDETSVVCTWVEVSCSLPGTAPAPTSVVSSLRLVAVGAGRGGGGGAAGGGGGVGV